MSTDVVMDFLLKKAKGELELPDLWRNNDIKLIRARSVKAIETRNTAVERADYVTLKNVKTVWWILTEYADNFCEDRPMLTDDFPLEMIAELLEMDKSEVITAIEFLEHIGIIFYDEVVVQSEWSACVKTILKPFDSCPYNADEGSLNYFFEEEAAGYVLRELRLTNKHVLQETKWNHYFHSSQDRYTVAYFCEGKK